MIMIICMISISIISMATLNSTKPPARQLIYIDRYRVRDLDF